jgi:hypothetical protein
MRHRVAVLACALAVLGIARESAQAQSIAPATAPNFETEPFSGSELSRGKRLTDAECAALPGAVWWPSTSRVSASAIITRPLAAPGLRLWSSLPPRPARRMRAGNSSLTISTSSVARPRCKTEARDGLAGWECLTSISAGQAPTVLPATTPSAEPHARSILSLRRSTRSNPVMDTPGSILPDTARRSCRRRAVGAAHGSGMRRACVLPALGAKQTRRSGSR